MNPASAQNPRVIVGVDNSPGARWALAWAIGEARLRRDPLLIVHVESLPRMSPTAVERLDPQVIAGLRSAGAQLIARLLDEVSGGPPQGIMTSAMSLVGDAGAALVRIARPGDLLVVGRTGRGWISRMSRPSVQRYCARHAPATLTCVQMPAADSFEEFEEFDERPADEARPANRSLFGRLRHRAEHSGDDRQYQRESAPRPGHSARRRGTGTPGPDDSLG